MVKRVIKRDERKEDFDREKLKRGIIRAAERADVKEDRARELADRIAERIEKEDREEMKAEEIRDKLLEELDREERAVADAFRAFREEKK